MTLCKQLKNLLQNRQRHIDRDSYHARSDSLFSDAKDVPALHQQNLHCIMSAIKIRRKRRSRVLEDIKGIYTITINHISVKLLLMLRRVKEDFRDLENFTMSQDKRRNLSLCDFMT